MAWGKVNVEEQRKKFIIALLNGMSMAQACRQFGISRVTGYKWHYRFEEEGDKGLVELSRAPHTNPNIISKNIEDKILNMKLKFNKFGPKKILAKLVEINPNLDWPCATTIGHILDRNGLVEKRKYRRRLAANIPSAFNGDSCNEVWCMDFKGTLRTLNKEKYDPFTITDSKSRYLIRCQILKRNNYSYVWGSLDKAFYEYGLPEYIVSDNGPPFATVGVGRLSRLSVTLIKAGVKPLWIYPGKPQQNGRHERMHGTMEKEIGNRMACSGAELKVKLAKFQEYYNFERPHEALGQKPPGKMYTKSNRTWSGRLVSPEYDQKYEVRKVQKDGTINYGGIRIFIGEALHEENIGLLEEENGRGVYYGDIPLGTINKKNKLERS